LSDQAMIKESYKRELIESNILFEENNHNIEKILHADEVIKSPGIADNIELVKQIKARKIPIISEIELAYRHMNKNSKIIAITGSNGKTTTATLIYEICKHAGINCALVGNVGFSFAKQVALDTKDIYVLEVSSFQLDDSYTFNPYIAVLLNITPDHLDRYNYVFQKYVESKFSIIKNQTPEDYFIYFSDDPIIQKNISEYKHILNQKITFTMNNNFKENGFLQGDDFIVQMNNERIEMSVYDLTIKGKHNQQNTMAATAAAMAMNIRNPKIKEAILAFNNLEHRMEFVACVRGVEFINDSKATNINSTWFALESIKKPTILIIGGQDKGNDYSIIIDLVKEKVKAIICMGVDNTKIHASFGVLNIPIENTLSAQEAVQKAYALADKGEVVLLSPACASFDLFKNYEDRGKQFKQAVKGL
ncbi:MAG: UDP-N-acetylmuramoyl-L-alanine--D-glutamate ligase, partial [Chitinophagaceae bacterium]